MPGNGGLAPCGESRSVRDRSRDIAGSARRSGALRVLPSSPIFDVRLLGAIGAALITLATLSNPEPEQKLARPRISRGEHGVQVLSFALSPTSAQIATTNTAGRVTLRAPENGWHIERFLDFPGYASAVAFSPEGRFLAAGGVAPGICLWDLSSPRSEPTDTMVVPIQRVKRIMFSPDGQSLAVTSESDGTILVWDLATRRARTVLHHTSRVDVIAFSPDGRRLATGELMLSSRSIILWDLQTGSGRIVQEDGLGLTKALAFSPDGTLLASARVADHHISLWDVDTGRKRQVFAGHTHGANSIAFSPDGSLLATAGNDGMVMLWTVATGHCTVSLDGQATCLLTVAFSPDGRTVVLATEDDDDIRLWDLDELLQAPPRPSSSPMKTGSI